MTALCSEVHFNCEIISSVANFLSITLPLFSFEIALQCKLSPQKGGQLPFAGNPFKLRQSYKQHIAMARFNVEQISIKRHFEIIMATFALASLTRNSHPRLACFFDLVEPREASCVNSVIRFRVRTHCCLYIYIYIYIYSYKTIFLYSYIFGGIF